MHFGELNFFTEYQDNLASFITDYFCDGSQDRNDSNMT